MKVPTKVIDWVGATNSAPEAATGPMPEIVAEVVVVLLFQERRVEAPWGMVCGETLREQKEVVVAEVDELVLCA